jgi:hypothetical protein
MASWEAALSRRHAQLLSGRIGSPILNRWGIDDMHALSAALAFALTPRLRPDG